MQDARHGQRRVPVPWSTAKYRSVQLLHIMKELSRISLAILDFWPLLYTLCIREHNTCEEELQNWDDCRRGKCRSWLHLRQDLSWSSHAKAKSWFAKQIYTPFKSYLQKIYRMMCSLTDTICLRFQLKDKDLWRVLSSKCTANSNRADVCARLSLPTQSWD